jgi:hypothetical protein
MPAVALVLYWLREERIALRLIEISARLELSEASPSTPSTRDPYPFANKSYKGAQNEAALLPSGLVVQLCAVFSCAVFSCAVFSCAVFSWRGLGITRSYEHIRR